MLQLVEESVGVVGAGGLVTSVEVAVGLYAVLQAVELPAGIADLDSGLADVHRDTLPL